MHQVLDIFLNGIAGVFIGISVLYIAIRINVFVCKPREKKEEST